MNISITTEKLGLIFPLHRKKQWKYFPYTATLVFWALRRLKPTGASTGAGLSAQSLRSKLTAPIPNAKYKTGKGGKFGDGE